MRKHLLSTILFLSFAVIVQAQTKEVTGKVTDSTGAPLAGASVNIKGGRGGTSVGTDGTFRITAPSNSTLVISAIGFDSKEVRIANVSDISVRLMIANRTLNEVVVTALGIRKEKRSLGYAAQTINSDELNKSGTGNPLNELSGKASGLTVINSAGDPGSGTFVLLRGVTSVTGNNQPLMVVDGVPIDNSSNNYDPQFNGFQAGGANADLLGATQPTNRGIDLNPNDIESVTLLKGPAATALYGIQAASGALVITTKKGAAGKHGTVTFNSSVTWDRHSQMPGLQNKFAQGDADANGIPTYQGPWSGQPFSWGPAIADLKWDGSSNNPWDKHGFIVDKSDPTGKTPVTAYNPYDFFQTGHTYENNVAAAGGNAESGYRMSLGNLDQSGIIPKAHYIKTTISLSGQSKISNKLNVSGGINYIKSSNYKVQQGSNTSGIMLGLLRTSPTFDNSNGVSDPVNDPTAYSFPNGAVFPGLPGYPAKTIAPGNQRSYRGTGSYDNPYWTINKNPFNSYLDRVFGYGALSYQPVDWITVNYRLGGDVYTQRDKNAFDVHTSAYKTGSVFLINYQNSQYNSDLTVTFKHKFGEDLTTSLLLGHNYFELTSNTTLTKGIGLNVPGFLDISNAQTLTNTESTGRKKTMAFFGDFELAYRSMLYLSVTGRREESSTLPSINNVFFYPSASLGWVFTELESLKGNNLLSFGKLRASVAQVGKDAPIYALTTPFSSPFAFTDGFATNGVTLNSFGISTNIASIGNPDLKPEKTVSYEGGVDLGILKDRITFNGTYYYSKSTDVILPASISYTSGFAGQLLNAATLTNKGVELTLNTTPIKSPSGLRWDLNFNWSHNANKVVSLAKGLDRLLLAGFGAGEFEIDAVVGHPFGVIYGNTTPHSSLMDLKSPLLISDVPNDPVNGVFGYGQPVYGGVGPNQVIGNPNPKWLGSVASNLSYKGLTLGVQVNIKHGGNVMNGTRGAITLRGLAKQTENRGTPTVFKGLLGHLDGSGNVVHYDGGVEKPGPGAANSIQSAYDENYWQNVGNSVGGGQEVDVEDGGYTKLRQVSLTYDLPKSILSKMKFSALSLTFFANNLHTWTKYDGVDPETSLSGPANAQGMDFFNNPGAKSYGIRLNVGL